MTTLVAYQGEGFAVIGADSRATEDGGFFIDCATSKIIQNGSYLIAVSGASRGGNVAQFGWTPPKPPKSNNTAVLDKFMTKTLIPSLRKAFIVAGFDAKNDGDAAWNDSNLLIAFNGIIYPIFNDYSWDREKRGVYFSGSGGELACGAFAVLKKNALDAGKELNADCISAIIEEAIAVSCQFSAYSSAPINVEVQLA